MTYTTAHNPVLTTRETVGTGTEIHPSDQRSRSTLLMAALDQQVQDPRVRMALAYSQDLITEPALSLGQLQEAFSFIHPGGRVSCRTIQRWAKDKGLPYGRNRSNDRRVYFLSACLQWYRQTFPVASIAEEASRQARLTLLPVR